MEKIEAAGLLSKVISILERFGNKLIDSIEDLAKYGYKVTEAEADKNETETNKQSFVLNIEVGNVGKMLVKATPTTNNQYTLEFKTADGSKTQKYDNVPMQKFKDKIVDAGLKFFDWDGIESITQEGSDVDITEQVFKASHRIKAKLSKITSDTDISIELTGIYADYSPEDVLRDLQAVADSDEFIDQLTEEPQMFDIAVVDDGNNLDVMPSVEDTINLYDVIRDIMRTEYKLLFDAHCIHWNIVGDNAMELHEHAQTCYEEAFDQVDTLGELCVELTGGISHPLDIFRDLIPLSGTSYDMDQGLTILRSDIQTLVDTLDLYRCNFKSDVQSVIDGWLRNWNKENDYFFKRILAK